MCPLQKQVVGADYKSVCMVENKWQKKGNIWEKWLSWTVALQPICLEIQEWSQTGKKAEITVDFLINTGSKIVDEIGEIPGSGKKNHP